MQGMGRECEVNPGKGGSSTHTEDGQVYRDGQVGREEVQQDGSTSAPTLPPRPFPDEVLEHVLAFISSHKDRNAVSLVCKAWLKADRWSRRSVFIGNCYSCSPQILTRRFPRVKALTLKGRPRFSDFNLVPPNWGANVLPWLHELAAKGPFLEELRLKRMTITDEGLFLVAQRFPNFRVLVLTFCDGFSTDGLSTVASNCRYLKHLNLFCAWL